MKFISGILVVAITALFTCKTKKTVLPTYTNEIRSDKMLLVLSAPSVYDTYYKPAFLDIVHFQIEYAKAIIGNDNVVVLVDENTKKYYEDKLPKDVLLIADVRDIWLRDFSTINPIKPVQFKYSWASMPKKQSEEVQASFNAFANTYTIQREKSNLIIDGGNIVDNYAGKIITTTRFMQDNHLTYTDAKAKLKQLFNATEVAILEPDEPVLAHSDGMVSWVDEKILLVNNYSDKPDFRQKVINELKLSFPSTSILEVPVGYKQNKPDEWKGFESACGVNVNATVTFKNIYLPIFNMKHENDFYKILQANTQKKIIKVNAEAVCGMGGSVRCLTWQLAGSNAQKLIMAARNKK
jgi:agmatine/peptidylarginine deiminase